MNRIYRLVFNRALGVMQVASELAKPPHGGATMEGGDAVSATVPRLRFAMWCALGLVLTSPSMGQSAPSRPAEAPPVRMASTPSAAPTNATQGRIVTDPNAPGSQRPTVIAAPNGVPLVNITTPSAKGVSRNAYSQFDVGSDGAILNNSRTNVQSQLGGWIQGNPWLATGTAKVILNEVNSANPSYLNGYIEVAGDRAEVVIANPAGIQVDGGGFLNASRATLTTGTPVFKGGALEGYRVERGAIGVNGAGLDASRTDYADLIARSMQINAGILASRLQVSLGANAVSADHAQVAAIPGAGATPTLALDVGALGGMYANKIWLVGTEHGVGMRNAGQIGAAAGDLVVTVDGRLESTGSLQSQRDAHVSAGGGIANAGTISASRELVLDTPADVDNSGGTLNAMRIEVDADALKNRGGAIEQTGIQALALNADALSNRDGGRIGLIAAEPGTGESGNGEGGSGTGNDDNGNGPGGTGDTGGETGGGTPPVVAPLADGALDIAGRLDNDGGTIVAGGGIALATGNGLDNAGGELALRELTVRQGDVRNEGGALTVLGATDLNVGLFDNEGGTFRANEALSLTAETLSNRDGDFGHAGTDDTRIVVRGLLDNTDGILASNAAHLEIEAGHLVNEQGAIQQAGTNGLSLSIDRLDGDRGTIATAGALRLSATEVSHRQAQLSARQVAIQATRLDNRGGQIVAIGTDASTLVVAGTLDNTEGTLASNGDLSLTAGELSNGGGTLLAAEGADLRVDVDGLLDNSTGGRVAAGGDLALQADTLDNRSGTIEQTGEDGALSIEADAFLAAGGTIRSNGALDLAVTDIDLRDGVTVARRIAIKAGNLTTAGGTLAMTGEGPLRVDVSDTLNNDGGTIAANGALQLTAQTLSNREGTLTAAGTGDTAVAVAGTFDNTDGTLATNANALTINTGHLVNERGAISHAGAQGLTLTTGRLDGNEGTIATAGALHLSATDMAHRDAVLSAAQVNIAADSFDNAGGRIVATGTDANRFDIADTLDNTRGVIAGNGDLSFDTEILVNAEGVVQQAGDGTLSIAAGTLQGEQGTLVSNGALTIAGQTVDLTGGVTSADRIAIEARDLTTADGRLVAMGADALTLWVDDTLDNTGGTVAGNGTLDLSAGALVNAGGTLQAAGAGHSALDVAGALDNREGAILTAGDAQVQAGSLDNRAGTVHAAGASQLRTDGRLDNSGQGMIASGGGLQLAAAELDNAAGTLAAGGAMDIATDAALDNAGGAIQAGQALRLDSAGLTNTDGQVVGGTLAVDTRGQAIDNARGVLASTDGALDLRSGALDNTAGLVQSAGNLSVDTHGQALTNRQSGANGGIVSLGTLDIVSGAFDNREGTVYARDDARLQADAIDNTLGAQLASAANLRVQGTMLSNNGGRVQAGEDAALSLTSALDNRMGLVAAGGTLTIAAGAIDNRDTLDAADAAGLQANALRVDAASLDNRSGLVVSDAQTRLALTGMLDNRDGQTSSGGTQDVTAAAVLNADGTLLSGDDQHITAGSLTGDGRVLSQGDLALNLDDDFTNTGEMTANGTVALTTQGDLVNRGALQGGGLDLHARNIDNAAGGEITAMGLAHLHADETLTNRGLIDGAVTHVEVGTLDNVGTGRMYGDRVAIQADALRNRNETLDGIAKAGAIAARERLDIGVGTLDNAGQGLIYSGGDAAIGGALDADLVAAGTADAVNNLGSTIDVTGELVIDAQAIKNIRENVVIAIEATQTVNETVTMHLASWQQNGGNSSSTLSQTNNYRAFQVLYLNPEDILEDGTFVTPDGYGIGRAVVRLTAQTSTYFMAYGGAYSARGERWRINPTDGTVTIYYTIRQDGQSNPDQIAGGDDPFQELTQYQRQTGHPVQYQTDNLTYSGTYGTCTINCVQLVTPWQYDDPAHTILNRINDPDSAGRNEQRRIAHHTAFDDTVGPDIGPEAVIRSGGTMRLTVDELTNRYGQIAAGGDLVIADHGGGYGHVVNVGQTLYRTHRFDNTTVAYDGSTRTWSNPPISEQIGQIGGTIVGNGTLVVDTGDLDNLDEGRDAPNVQESVRMAASDPQGGASAVGPDAISVDGPTRQDGHTADQAATGAVQAVDGAPGPAGATVVRATGDAPGVVVTPAVDTAPPVSSLFHVDPANGSYLIETDPRFADYRHWLGSDYLLDALGYAPTTLHKRLGDGYYEQMLVRDQIGQLTGRRFLEGYASDEEQFRALMEAGALFARQFGLRPGVALSAEQMAQLTSDIVWLVEQTVTLSDGSTVTVLAPQVYLRLRDGDLHENGALLAGANVRLNLKGDFVNTGDVAGREVVSIDASNIRNLDGGVIGGRAVGLQATQDIDVIGATVTAGDALGVKAGGNVTVASTVQTLEGGGFQQYSNTDIDRVAGLYVTNPGGLGVLSVDAGGDVVLQAAQIRNAGLNGLTQIAAAGDLNLGTVTTAQNHNYDYDAKNYRHSASTTEVGTTIEGASHIQLIAGNDINTAGATISSEQGQIALVAGHDVNLLESRNTSSVSGSETHKKSGLLSSTRTEKTWQVDSRTATGTTLSGDSVLVQAGHDVTTRGADVVATHDVDMVAGHDIDIGAATETYDQAYTSKTRKSGLVDLSLTSVTIGNRQIGNDTTIKETVQKGSTVGSLEGNVSLTAGNHYAQTGSTVSALEGDVGILAQSVDIQSAQDTTVTSTVDTFKQKGITASFSSPVTDTLQGAYGASRDVGKSQDARVNAMAVANAGYSAYKAGQAMQAPGGGANNGSGQKGGNLSVSITYGQQQSKATSTTTEIANQASAVHGDRVNIAATGAGQDSNINVIGSDIDSKSGTALQADNVINLLAAQDTTDYTSQNSSQGWNAGVAISFGNGNGAAFGFTAGGNAGKGNADMSAVTQRNTTVGSDGTTTLVSGGATTLRGAQVSGNQVIVDAGELNIESLQDTETYKSAQKDASAQVTVGYGFSASGSYSQSNVKSDYASVGQQSGILAGDGGYRVNVKNNTDLKGGIVTSTQAAEDAGNNRLTTGTLTASDIDNHANYQASGISLGGGIGKSSSQQGVGVNKALGFGRDGDSQSSTTRSGVNTGNLTITDTAGQAATGKAADQVKAEVATGTTTDRVAQDSGALTNKFDANEVEREMGVQMRVTQVFDRTQQGVRNEINVNIDVARQHREEAEAILKANPDLSIEQKSALLAIALDAQNEIERLQKVGVLVSAIAGGLSSPANNAGGIAAATLAPEVSYMVGQYFKENAARNVKDNGDRPEEGSAMHLLTHALLGAVVAGAGGGDALVAGIAAGGAEAAAPALAELLYGKKAQELTAEEKETVGAIVGMGGSAIGALQGDVANLITGGSAAQNAVDNNWGEVGHYSTMATILYLAGFSEQNAKAVALSAWAPDTDKRNAMATSSIISGVFSAGDQQLIHMLTAGSPEDMLKNQENLGKAVAVILGKIQQYDNNPAVKAEILSSPVIQRILHSFGDSFAHVKENGKGFVPVLGHVFKGTEPDNPDEHPDAYSQYVSELYQIASNSTGAVRRDSAYVADLARRVSSVTGEDAQKKVLDGSITAITGAWSSGMVSSPIKDCGFFAIFTNCGNKKPSNTTNPVIRRVYELDKEPELPPIIDWSKIKPLGS